MMTAITHQRAENSNEIIKNALVLYDHADEELQRLMFRDAIASIASSVSVKQQREWIARQDKMIEAI